MKTQNTVWCKCIWPLEDESYSICMKCGNQLRKYKNNEGSPLLPEEELKTVTPRQIRLTYRGKEIPTESWHDLELEDTQRIASPANVMYAIYAQSGFYKSWKFVHVPENVFYPYVEITDAMMKFCEKWPGFTRILKVEKTDLKTY